MNQDKKSINPEIQQKKQQLIDRLKTDHPEIYKWFIDRKINLHNLGKYSSNITTALALISATSQSPATPPPIPEPTRQIKTLDKSQLRGLSDTQKASLVWERYGALIHNTAANYSLDPNLIFATIMIESDGNTNAIRHEPRINDASYGLGQILYGTAKGIGFEGKPTDLFDPATNIDLIGKYHRRNLDAYGGNLTPEQLTTAYNTGSPHKKALPGHLKKFNKWYNRVANLEVDLT